MLTRRRVSGRKLAEQLGVSPSWISYRLTGAQPIDLNDLERIAAALNVEVVDLLPRATEGHSVISVGAPQEKITRAYPRLTKQPTPPGRPTRTHQHSSSRRTVRLTSNQRPAS